MRAAVTKVVVMTQTQKRMQVVKLILSRTKINHNLEINKLKSVMLLVYAHMFQVRSYILVEKKKKGLVKKS